MANTGRPSTPASPSAATPVSTPSPGRWRHPQFDEIARRQNEDTFDERSIRVILSNGGALVLLWLLTVNLESNWYAFAIPQTTKTYGPYLRLLLSCLFLYNMVFAILPAIKSKDDITDITLTPTQRSLLGLKPSSTPSSATPGAHYITPPRYARSSTPRNSSPLSRGSTDSPLSRKGSPLGTRQGSDSPFSPSASPLWQKAVGSGRDSLRRQSYGSQSPLGLGSGKDLGVLGAPSTPSPSTGRGTSVGLNSKWLYERGRASPSGRSLYS